MEWVYFNVLQYKDNLKTIGSKCNSNSIIIANYNINSKNNDNNTCDNSHDGGTVTIIEIGI